MAKREIRIQAKPKVSPKKQKIKNFMFEKFSFGLEASPQASKSFKWYETYKTFFD
jgi:hypothetical protein